MDPPLVLVSFAKTARASQALVDRPFSVTFLGEDQLQLATGIGPVVLESPAQGWLVISVSTAGAAGSLRVQVWRKLRSLGALYLQQSVCLLPAQPEVVREVRRLVDRVHRHGGTARVLRMAFTDPSRSAR